MTKNIYLISALLDDKKIYKIGYTKREVSKRIKELETGNPYEFDIEKVYVTENYANSIENRIHKHFLFKKIRGEWFDLDEEDIEEFENLCGMYYNTIESLKDNTYIQEKGITFK